MYVCIHPKKPTFLFSLISNIIDSVEINETYLNDTAFYLSSSYIMHISSAFKIPEFNLITFLGFIVS